MALNNTELPELSTRRRQSVFKRQINKIEFNGNEGVKHSEVKNEDFVLPLQDHVANYNPETLTKHWNDNKTAENLLTKIYMAFRHGVPRRTGPIIILDLILFYTFSIVLLTHVCVPSFSKNALNLCGTS